MLYQTQWCHPFNLLKALDSTITWRRRHASVLAEAVNRPTVLRRRRRWRQRGRWRRRLSPRPLSPRPLSPRPLSPRPMGRCSQRSLVVGLLQIRHSLRRRRDFDRSHVSYCELGATSSFKKDIYSWQEGKGIGRVLLRVDVTLPISPSCGVVLTWRGLRRPVSRSAGRGVSRKVRGKRRGPLQERQQQLLRSLTTRRSPTSGTIIH